MLVLVEGSRATWMVQECPIMGQGKPTRARIRPSSPARLLAAALLGYGALTQPDLVKGSDTLRNAVEVDRRRDEVRILPLEDELADHVIDVCSSAVYGVLTTMPGSSIRDRDLQMGAAHGLVIAGAHVTELSV
ncbi:MAG TPA: hypothetical protein PLI79_02925 [Mycobacterium sp.]|nr:hypothetical protein [Mycobacterium sp.]